MKSVLFYLLWASLLPWLLREFFQRDRVTILCYHKLDPSRADRHLEVLRRHYSVVGLREYVAKRMTGGVRLPPKALIVTFDDGHRLHYSLKPTFEKHRVPITTFLCSGITGTHRHFWYETAMSSADLSALKTAPDAERLERLRQLGFVETAEQPERQALTWAEVDAMRHVVDFQSHTVFHPILPRCTESRSQREISQAKRELEERLGSVVFAVAYPNGDYSPREIAFAREAGYECGLTLDAGFNSHRTPLFTLKRICMNDKADKAELLVRASGLWDLMKAVARRLKHGRQLAKGAF